MTNQPFQENCKDKAVPPPNYHLQIIHEISMGSLETERPENKCCTAGRKLPVISLMSGFPRSGHSLQDYTNQVKKKEKQTSNQPNLYPPLLHGDTTQLLGEQLRKNSTSVKKASRTAVKLEPSLFIRQSNLGLN